MHHDRTDRRIGQAGVLLGILATSLPAAFADDARTEAAGTWFITRASSVELRSAGPEIAQYPVLRLGRGELLRLDGTDFDGDWARVHLVGPAVADVRGLMQLGTSTLVDGDIAVVQDSTPLFAPNLRGRDENGQVSPRRSWRSLIRLAPGSKVFVTERFEIDGEAWALVAPPEGVMLWVDPSKVRPATEDEIPPATAMLTVEEQVEQEIAARIAAAESARLESLAAAEALAMNPIAEQDVMPEAPGGGLALARPLDPLPDDVAAAPEGDWFIISKDDSRIYSQPYGTPGSYAVQKLPKGVAVLVVDFEDGSARIAAVEGARAVRGLLEVTGAVEIDGDTARIVDACELRAPNLTSTEDDQPNPMRSYTTMLELLGGETLAIADRFEAGGAEWLLVEPPAEARLFVRGGEIRAASAEEIEMILRPAAAESPTATADDEPVIDIEPEIETDVIVSGDDETGDPVDWAVERDDTEIEAVEPEAVEPETVRPAPQVEKPREIQRVLPPPSADELREITAEVQFEDGASGIWKMTRNPRQGLRTDAAGVNGYTFARLAEGSLVCVVNEADNGWCDVRLIGPDVEDVRILLKADPNGIEVRGDRATIVDGTHELRAPSQAGRELDDDGRPDPRRSFISFREASAGEEFQITDTFVDDRGDTWYLVVPPLDITGCIHSGYLKTVPPDALPVADGVDQTGRPHFVLERQSTPPAAVTEIDDDVEDDVVQVAETDDLDMTETDDDDAIVAVVIETESDDADDMDDESTVPVEPEVETEPETEVEVEVEVEVEPETEPEPEVEVEPEPEVDLIDDPTESDDDAAETVEEMDDDGEVTFEDDVTEVEPEPEPAPTLSPELLQNVTLSEAEAAYAEIRDSNPNDAEFEALILIYRTISERPSTLPGDRTKAETRLRHIEIQRSMQRNIDALQRLENRTKADRARIEAIREALLDRADYTAIGRMSRSRVYDGRTLPLLYRLEDPSSGRTIAYVQPNDALSIQSGVGRIVGIVGTERDDPGYRIRIITPDRFEIDLTEEITEN